MSCNGCRILRKGCSQDCTLRPCLQWLANPQYQSNATFFLAKFYGRAGLINLINAGPHHLRPAIFRSLLYEACGRIVDPVHGSAGLLCSGSWHLCQAAVEAVLKGLPIEQLSPSGSSGPPMMKSCDIRHVSKVERSGEVHKINHRGRFKRSVLPKQRLGSAIDFITESKVEETTEVGFVVGDMAEASSRRRAEDGGVRLELSLGLEPVPHAFRMAAAGHVQVLMGDNDSWDDSTCQLRLGLHLPP